MRRALPLLFLPLLPGCIAQTAIDVATLPVRVVGAGVDAVTTSQAEADRRRGRQIREEEERIGRLARRCARRPERAECAELRTGESGSNPKPVSG